MQSASNFLMVWKWHRMLATMQSNAQDDRAKKSNHSMISFAFQWEWNDQSPGENKKYNRMNTSFNNYSRFNVSDRSWFALVILQLCTTLWIARLLALLAVQVLFASGITSLLDTAGAESIQKQALYYAAANDLMQETILSLTKNSQLILFALVVSAPHWFVCC